MDTSDSKETESSSDLLGTYGDAQMSVDIGSIKYNMNHAKRGKAVIFNNKEFLLRHLKVRNGTDLDRDELEITLVGLGFDVAIYNNASIYKIKEVIKQLSKEDHTDHDCLLIAVFSHGEENLIYSSDTSFKPDFLWDHFTAEKCKTLAGKPKIFLVQACQGDKVDSGTKLQAFKSRTATDCTDSVPECYRIPNRADFLVIYSTVPGYYSWRNTAEGSWFIQAFNEVVREYAYKLDLLSMMTYVSRKVALHFESKDPNSPMMDKKKQVPYVTSTLIREVHFSKK